VTEVNPEFLAALPPSIQEEVLAQQRLELQRQAAAAANPNDPVDAAAFFQNLQPSLRQAVSETHTYTHLTKTTKYNRIDSVKNIFDRLFSFGVYTHCTVCDP
jgi:hypothetical protein